MQKEDWHIHVDERVHLSPTRETDKPAFLEYLNNKAIYDRTLRLPHPYIEEHAEQFLAFVAKNTKQHGHPMDFVVRDETSKAIGGIGLHELIAGHRGEIGYWLAQPFWGRGIMTAVVGSFCEFAVKKWGLVRITAHVFSFNQASARVVEKNGFACEGLLRKHHRKDGHFLDAKLYALVR